ncbi:MAG: DNA primase [Steroidobacteraceae bacterium]
MSGRIPQHFIDELVARADIIEVIGSRVPLKKGGKEYKACCPFHDEKSPSFTVVPDKQFYHCFGCGAHGTALGFLMEYDHLGFVEAVEELAARVGLEVPREQDATVKPKPADDLFAVLDQVAEFYRRQFREDPRVTDYARRRGLSEDTLSRFGIGYSPNSWDALLRAFGATEADQRRLLQAGLVIERERKGPGESGDANPGAGRGGGYYDRFRDRLMFPIRDSRGRTLGFGGRVIDQGEPKYLNSPETELFHKGRELYGLYEARQATRNLTRLMVVEGYMDVARLHQAGITYAVATLGTATTPDHLQRLFRIVNEVVFCFDGDRAGKAAAWRALENALPQVRQGRQIRFLFLPDGHDPDSLVGEEGREAFEARLKGALSFSDYFIRELSSRVDITTVDGRAQLAETAGPLVEKITPGVYRELLVDALARVVGMAPEKLESLLSLGSDRKGDAAAAPRPASFRAPAYRSPPQRTALGAGRGSLVRQAVRILVHHPALAAEIAVPAELKSVDQPGATLLNQLLEQLKDDPCSSMAVLLVRWRDHPNFDSLDKLSQQEAPPDSVAAKAELEGALKRLIADYPLQRTQWLLDKEKAGPLSQDERKELQMLLSAPRSADTART